MGSISIATPARPSMPTISMKSGNFEVLGNGTVITASSSSDLRFQLEGLGIVMKFEGDGAESPSMQSHRSGTLELTLVLKNFNSSIGAGTTNPIEIGHLAGRKLWLSFMIYAMSPSSAKTVHYTFLSGDNA